MGVEKDYLMRQLMLLFEVIQKILGHRRKGDNDEAEEQIKYFYNCLKIDEDLRKLSIESLMELLSKQKKFSNEHIEMVAIVLKEQGELATETKEKLDFFRKAYFILDKVECESTSFSLERQMKLEELKQYLN